MSHETKDAYRADLLARAAPEIVSWQPFRTEVVAPRLWETLKEDVADGVAGAADVMDEIGREGARKALSDAKRKASSGLILVKRDGQKSAEKRQNPGFRATARISGAGESYFQQSIWWEMGYDEFATLFQSVLRAFDGAAQRVAGFRRVMDAYETHPVAANAAEACRLAGFDPREIEISDFDVRRARAS